MQAIESENNFYIYYICMPELAIEQIILDNNKQIKLTIAHLNTVAMAPIYLLNNCISIHPFCIAIFQ